MTNTKKNNGNKNSLKLAVPIKKSPRNMKKKRASSNTAVAVPLSPKSPSTLSSNAGNSQTKKKLSNVLRTKPKSNKSFPKIDSILPYTSEFRPKDVLFGRGGGMNTHEGNINYRRICSKYKQAFCGARTKHEKSLVVDMAAKEFNELGIAFLEKIGNQKYSFVKHGRILKKITQALRDRWTADEKAKVSLPLSSSEESEEGMRPSISTVKSSSKKRKTPSIALPSSSPFSSSSSVDVVDGISVPSILSDTTLTTCVINDDSPKKPIKKRKVPPKRKLPRSQSTRFMPSRLAKSKAQENLGYGWDSEGSEGSCNGKNILEDVSVEGCSPSISQSGMLSVIPTTSTFRECSSFAESSESNTNAGWTADSARSVMKNSMFFASTLSNQVSLSSTTFAPRDLVGGTSKAFESSSLSTSSPWLIATTNSSAMTSNWESETIGFCTSRSEQQAPASKGFLINADKQGNQKFISTSFGEIQDSAFIPDSDDLPRRASIADAVLNVDTGSVGLLPSSIYQLERQPINYPSPEGFNGVTYNTHLPRTSPCPDMAASVPSSCTDLTSSQLASPSLTTITASSNCTSSCSHGPDGFLSPPPSTSIQSLPSVCLKSAVANKSSVKKPRQSVTWDLSNISACGQGVVSLFSPIKLPKFSGNSHIGDVEAHTRPKQFVVPAGFAQNRDIRDRVDLGCELESLESLSGSSKDLKCRTHGVEWTSNGIVPVKVNPLDAKDHGFFPTKDSSIAIEDCLTSPQRDVVESTTECRCVVIQGDSMIEAQQCPNGSTGASVPSLLPPISHRRKNFRTGIVLWDSPKSGIDNAKLGAAEDLMTSSKKCSPRRVSPPEPEPLSSDTIAEGFEPCGIVTGKDDISVFGATSTTNEDVDLYHMFVQTGFLDSKMIAI